MAEAQVRAASAGDGLAIAWIQLEVWQTAFAGLLPEAVLGIPAADLAQAWTSTIRSTAQTLLVATEGEQLVGFTQAALADDGPEVGEIRLLYVRPAWARRGHGGRLVAAAAAALRARGAEIGAWWIPDSDIASQRFATSIGWEQSGGARILDTGRAMLTERRWTGTLELVLGGFDGSDGGGQ
jgi:GNAT superfamily N-acetyltransferase